MKKLPEFSKNKILFGWDDEEGIVAIELLNDSTVEIISRKNGKVISRNEDFQPFLLINKEDYLVCLDEKFEVKELGGDNFFKYLVLVKTWGSLIRAKQHLQKVSGEPSSSPRAPYLFFNDPIHQYMLLTGKTLFKGMDMASIRRLQLDIETYCEKDFEFSNPLREKDRIISIAVSDNHGYEHVINGRKLEEREMLLELNRIIHERNPDVIEGHNIFKFDLEYIATRAKRNKVELKWGRNGEKAVSHASRVVFAERTIAYPKWEVYGRHIIDTWLLAQAYDTSAREFDEYSLKKIAVQMGVSSSDRIYIEGKDIAGVFDNDPDRLFKYNLDDVKETRALAELFGEGYFIETQFFPYSYQNIIVRGNATKINSLFIREYLMCNHSIPQIPSSRNEFEGGYTDIFKTGIIEGVVHCDVRSLYPSIMINFGLKPASDDLDIFLNLLKELRDFRIKAKETSIKADDEKSRRYFNALQSAFKILINSFYGYLAAGFSNFADYERAAEITAKGREIIKIMLEWLKKNDCEPIEIDTDGIYFVPPEIVKNKKDEESLVKKLSDSLPKGIEVEYGGRYRSMFSYKMKNYALLDYNGKLSIKGSGLKSRGLEKFQREFLKKMIYLMLTGKKQETTALYDDYIKKIREHKFDISILAKTETLSDSLEVYKQKTTGKKRNFSASYELAIKSGRNYQPGDQISYYVTGTKKKVTVYESCKLVSEWDKKNPDENVEYYCAKLDELYKKFGEMLV